MNIAFGFSGSVFEWMSTPEQAWRGQRVGKAMQQFHRAVNSNVSEGDFMYQFHRSHYPDDRIQTFLGTSWILPL